MSTEIEQETQSGHSENMLERLANRIGGSVRVKTIFGDPVEKDGVTVIPVARARWGVGGGSNAGGNTRENQTGESTGTGSGGGVTVFPTGYVEVRDGRARFHPIYDPANVAQIIVASGIVAVLLLRAVRWLMSR
ncbi:MAG TPA: spore germination protein GerW family protein [Ktedonobacteraceae bacterium]